MLRTGADYLESLRDGRCVMIGKDRVADVTVVAPLTEQSATSHSLTLHRFGHAPHEQSVAYGIEEL